MARAISARALSRRRAKYTKTRGAGDLVADPKALGIGKKSVGAEFLCLIAIKLALPQEPPEVLGILCNPSSLSPSRRVPRVFHLLQLRACGNLTSGPFRWSQSKITSRAATVRERS